MVQWLFINCLKSTLCVSLLLSGIHQAPLKSASLLCSNDLLGRNFYGLYKESECLGTFINTIFLCSESWHFQDCTEQRGFHVEPTYNSLAFKASKFNVLASFLIFVYLPMALFKASLRAWLLQSERSTIIKVRLKELLFNYIVNNVQT